MKFTLNRVHGSDLETVVLKVNGEAVFIGSSRTAKSVEQALEIALKLGSAYGNEHGVYERVSK